MSAPGRAEAIRALAEAYTRRVPKGAFAGLTEEQLGAQVESLFEFADRRGSDPHAVRALRPALAEHGYETSGTVVETNTADSPFLVDSVTGALARWGEPISVLHPVIGVKRDTAGRITSVCHAREAPAVESVMHFELDRHLPSDQLPALERAVRGALGDVRAAVSDFATMRERVAAMAALASAAAVRYDEDEVAEAQTFLRWLLDDDFVLLGAREYELIDGPQGRALRAVPGSGLGILTETATSTYADPVPLAALDPKLRARIEGDDLLLVAKTERRSTVHRPARMDYIGVKRVAPSGEIAGESRLLGLFTSKAYLAPASDVPLLRRKLARILDAEDLIEGSHDHKAAVTIFESFPKDELFAAPWEDLRAAVMTLLALAEQQHVSLLQRPDPRERSVSLLVAMPRDRFNAELRQQLQDLFVERLGGIGVDYHLSLGEGDPAQVHFTVHVGPAGIPEISFQALEQEVIELTRTWEDRLEELLVTRHGAERGRALARRFAPRLPDHYKAQTDVALALGDVESLERLETSEQPFVVSLQNEPAASRRLTRVGLYRRGEAARLSELVPVLEALGLRVVEERPTRLVGVERETHVQDFGVLGADGQSLDTDACGERVAECVAAVLRGEAESDSLNRLVVTAGLHWRQVDVLRAYRTYRQRVSTGLTEQYRNDAFAAHPEIAAKLVRLFELRFDPQKPRGALAEEALRQAILADVDSVSSLDADRILRGQLGLLDATVRTNAFKPGRESLSFKLRSTDVPGMPEPAPMFEIFVYAPEVEGIHLRGGLLARGGLRFSDRREDYRVEVLGLLKAQMTKNAVIVPTGAKGGFVLRRPPRGQRALAEAVRRAYVTFVRGLLDLTDNRSAGQVSNPDGVRVLDESDPYLVVAADKGTAQLSDTANAVAAEYGFWLGDAFASGGQTGYDHKALGITARGAWESVKRHFRELGLDVTQDPLSVVGVGDMSGDVFGNGMLRSERLRLIAAFDHRHVFIDPDPDPAAAFAERTRLFALPGSSWEDYDGAAISSGGGVWPRSAKSIALSPQARAALAIDAAALTPEETIGAILRAPVDLLWNGGVGTYVKATEETHAEVGDRSNDGLRVDAHELRCRAVGEGGNLGLTQRARIEYDRAGGLINADFIDNSAGVDCSDHEVNLKILLSLALERGQLEFEQRDELLAAVAGEVTAHVLYDNFLQAQILSQEAAASPGRLDAYEELMRALEARGALSRELEHLPPEEELARRRRGGEGMARPELAVLLAYSKRDLANALLRSELPEDPYLGQDLRDYFPGAVVERFEGLLSEHPLRRELIAMIVANDVVNSQGIAFVSWLGAETGVGAAEVIRAYRIARDVSGAVQRWAAIEALAGQVSAPIGLELLGGVDRLVQALTRWYLTRSPGAEIGDLVAAARGPFEQLAAVLPELCSPARQAERELLVARLVEEGVPAAVAQRHGAAAELVHAPLIAAVAGQHAQPLEQVAHACFVLGEALELGALERRLEPPASASRWQRIALQALDDELSSVRGELLDQLIAERDGRGVDEALARFLDARAAPLARLRGVMSAAGEESAGDLATLTVALRALKAMAG